MTQEKSKVEEGRKKTGGRKKGTPNKLTQGVQAKLDSVGCDPIEGMAKIAIQAHKEGDLPLAGNMYKELAQYIAPKRKSVEHRGAVGTIDLSDKTDAELKAIINGS